MGVDVPEVTAPVDVEGMQARLEACGVEWQDVTKNVGGVRFAPEGRTGVRMVMPRLTTQDAARRARQMEYNGALLRSWDGTEY